MDEARIRELVDRLDTSSTAADQAAWEELKAIGEEVVPYLADAFATARRWQQRVSYVFHAIPYARDNDAAFRLGLAALTDRSYMVRYRGCGLLAYSMRREALPALERLLTSSDTRSVEDAKAAIDALEHRNHHYFVDRDHSGRSYWVVHPEDEPGADPRA